MARLICDLQNAILDITVLQKASHPGARKQYTITMTRSFSIPSLLSFLMDVDSITGRHIAESSAQNPGPDQQAPTTLLLKLWAHLLKIPPWSTTLLKEIPPLRHRLRADRESHSLHTTSFHLRSRQLSKWREWCLPAGL